MSVRHFDKTTRKAVRVFSVPFGVLDIPMPPVRAPRPEAFTKSAPPPKHAPGFSERYLNRV